MDPAHQDAAEEMAAIARGDRRALRSLIERHGRMLTLVATRYLGRADEADEVVQDVFVRAWRHAARFDPQRAKVSTWLYRIAVNLCIDRQRKRLLLGMVGLDRAAEVPDAQPTATDLLEGRDRLAEARRAIARLPGRQRMALLLSSVAGLETSEIATAMRSSPGAVEQLLVRARRALRDELNRHEDLER